MATNEYEGVETRQGITLPLTDEDRRMVGYIFGTENISPEMLSPAAKVAVLERLVQIALPRDDRAFKSIAAIVQLSSFGNGSGARIYPLESEQSTRFALLATHTGFPEPVYYARRGTKSEAKSAHMLVERPHESIRFYSFWSLEIVWQLAQTNPEDEGTFEDGYSVGMDWKARSHQLKPLYRQALADALARQAIGPAGNPSGTLREAIRSLMHYMDWTLRHRKRRLEEAAMRSTLMNKAAQHMGVTF